MPSPQRTRELINTDQGENTANKTYSGNNTFSGTNSVTGTIAPSGTGKVSTLVAITDPGNGNDIPVTASGYVPLVTNGAETRKLAAPTFIGQTLLLYMKTDGGDCVVKCSTTVNETGNNTLTFDNIGEVIYLIAVEEGANLPNLRWRVIGNDGVGLTTQ